MTRIGTVVVTVEIDTVMAVTIWITVTGSMIVATGRIVVMTVIRVITVITAMTGMDIEIMDIAISTDVSMRGIVSRIGMVQTTTAVTVMSVVTNTGPITEMISQRPAAGVRWYVSPDSCEWLLPLEPRG